MLTIPIGDVPSQIFSTTVGGQQVRLRIFTRRQALFADVYVAGTLIVAGALCKNGVPLMRGAYLGFVGDLMFIDTQGAFDPSSPGLGSRYTLVYLSTADLEAT